MVSRAAKAGRERISRYVSVEQGDILLVDFGKHQEGSRNLLGKRPVYVLSNIKNDSLNSVLMVIPLFRNRSRDNAETDVKIRTLDCNGLRYDEYAQPLNARKIRRYQIIKRLGKVKGKAIHSEILSSMWQQVDSDDGIK